MILRPATPADFPFIEGLTQGAAYTPHLGHADAAQLAAWAADPACRLLIWDDNSAPQGFAIFREIGDPSGAVELFRLALVHIGGGQGRAFVRALTGHAFTQLGAAKVWLDASHENTRACALYLACGYREEGRLRQQWYRPALGRNVDLVLYGILRGEWESLPA